MVHFVLEDFSKTASMDLSGTFETMVLPTFDSSATAILHIPIDTIKSVFQFQTDSIDVTNHASWDIKYYIDSSDNWPFISGGKTEWFGTHTADDPYPDEYNCLAMAIVTVNPITSDIIDSIKEDFIRYLAFKLFNTHQGVDLFNNEEEMVNNLNTQLVGVQTAIKNLLDERNLTATDGMVVDANGNYLTNNTTSQNFTKILLEQMIGAEPERFKTILGQNTRQPLPFLGGDTIDFLLTIQPEANQHNLTKLDEPIQDRTYKIRIIVDDNA